MNRVPMLRDFPVTNVIPANAPRPDMLYIGPVVAYDDGSEEGRIDVGGNIAAFEACRVMEVEPTGFTPWIGDKPHSAPIKVGSIMACLLRVDNHRLKVFKACYKDDYYNTQDRIDEEFSGTVLEDNEHGDGVYRRATVVSLPDVRLPGIIEFPNVSHSSLILKATFEWPNVVNPVFDEKRDGVSLHTKNQVDDPSSLIQVGTKVMAWVVKSTESRAMVMAMGLRTDFEAVREEHKKLAEQPAVQPLMGVLIQRRSKPVPMARPEKEEEKLPPPPKIVHTPLVGVKIGRSPRIKGLRPCDSEQLDIVRRSLENGDQAAEA